MLAPLAEVSVISERLPSEAVRAGRLVCRTV